MIIKKYELLNESLKALSKSTIKLLILQGEQGCGKTYTTLKYLQENKLNYHYINNYATPLSFYQLLYENRKRDVIVFDDIQGIKDPKICSILKAACWESEGNKRVINYHSTSPILEKNELPSSFELEANIILIFNDKLNGFEPIIDRGFLIRFSFSFKEKLRIFDLFKDQANISSEVLDYIKINCNEATQNLSIRSLVNLSKMQKDGFDFKIFAKEMLIQDEEIEDLITMSSTEWCSNTGKHRATYFRKKKKYKISKEERYF